MHAGGFLLVAGLLKVFDDPENGGKE